jgi:hypothetical protein
MPETHLPLLPHAKRHMRKRRVEGPSGKWMIEDIEGSDRESRMIDGICGAILLPLASENRVEARKISACE